jgi:CHAD domain-containing protein
MNHQEIESIIKKRFEEINIAFYGLREHFIEGDIHAFRVKVKKLKACLCLMDSAEKHHTPLKLPQKIAKIYKISGAIRTLQIQQNHVQILLNGNQIAPPETYLKLISGNLLQHIEIANKLINGKSFFKKAEVRLLHLLPHQLNPDTINKYVASEEDRLEELVAPVFLTDKSLHAVRKILKNLLYISPYIAFDDNVTPPFSLLSGQENIESFTIILGNFHDLNIAIDNLHADCLKIKIDENEKLLLRTIESIWIKERELIRKKIYDQIQKIAASRRPVKSLVNWPVM